MKKITRLITVVLALCMAFSTVAFAAEPEMSVTEVSDIQTYVSEIAGEVGIEPRDAAPPITDADIIDILQDTDTGEIYVVVEVVGYGSTYGYIDGTRTDDYTITPVGSPIVTGFIYIFNCGVLSSGSHTFRYSGTSYNRPWNTVNRQIRFDVP